MATSVMSLQKKLIIINAGDLSLWWSLSQWSLHLSQYWFLAWFCPNILNDIDNLFFMTSSGHYYDLHTTRFGEILEALLLHDYENETQIKELLDNNQRS